MDVIDDAPLFLQGALDRFCIQRDFLEPIAKFVVGLLQTFPMTAEVAISLANQQAEGSGEQQPGWRVPSG